MPVSRRPRKPRGTPQYQRDLQVNRGRPAPPAVPQAARQAAAPSSPPLPPPRGPRFRLSGRAKVGLAITGGVGAVGYAMSPSGKRIRRKAKIGGAMGRSSPEFRHLPRSERKAMINSVNDSYEQAQGVGKSVHSALASAAKPENIERAARMVAAAAGEAKKPAKGATRARRTAQAAASAATPTRTKLKVVGGATAATVGTGALFGGGIGLGNRVTNRRPHKVTTAKAETATAVRRVATPKGPSGKFVSHENDLKVYTPRFKSTRRAPRDSRVQVWRKGGDAASKPWVEKADSGRSVHNPNRKGMRIA